MTLQTFRQLAERLKVPLGGFRGKLPSGYLQLKSQISIKLVFDTASSDFRLSFSIKVIKIVI